MCHAGAHVYASLVVSLPLASHCFWTSGLSAIACFCGRCQAPVQGASGGFELLVSSALAAPMDYQPAIFGWLILTKVIPLPSVPASSTWAAAK